MVGLCEEITEKERNEIIRITDDRNKCSPLRTKVTCQDYLKINLIDWIHWVIRIEWNQDEFAKYQENKYGAYSQGSSNQEDQAFILSSSVVPRSQISENPLRYSQDWHDMIIWGRTQNWYTWPKAEIGWKPKGRMGSDLPMDDESLILFVSSITITLRLFFCFQSFPKINAFITVYLFLDLL